MNFKKSWKTFTFTAMVLLVWTFGSAMAASHSKKPNILLLMSDDVGIANISAYSMGLMLAMPTSSLMMSRMLGFSEWLAAIAGPAVHISSKSPANINIFNVFLRSIFFSFLFFFLTTSQIEIRYEACVSSLANAF